jgi:hypothetical protein
LRLEDDDDCDNEAVRDVTVTTLSSAAAFCPDIALSTDTAVRGLRGRIEEPKPVPLRHVKLLLIGEAIMLARIWLVTVIRSFISTNIVSTGESE